jgi:hypothetical protein
MPSGFFYYNLIIGIALIYLIAICFTSSQLYDLPSPFRYFSRSS